MLTNEFLKILHNTGHISINNFIFKHLFAKNVTWSERGNYIQKIQRDLRVYIGSNDERSLFV